MTRPVLPAAILLALLACSGADEGVTEVPGSAMRTIGDVEYRARTHLLESFPVQVQTEVTISNQGPTPADITFPDGCVLLLRAYDNAARSGAPVWDQAQAYGCTMAVVERTIAAGGEEEFRVRVGAEDILGDSLPDARYYLTAVLRPNRTTVEITAGEADLALPR